MIGFSKKADEEGFIVIYPEGVNRSWNLDHCCGSALENQVDDLGFILKVIEDVENNQKIDQRRIYATGMSNAAMMSYRLTSESSYKFAAIGPVAGTIGGKATENSSLYLPEEPFQPV